MRLLSFFLILSMILLSACVPQPSSEEACSDLPGLDCEIKVAKKYGLVDGCLEKDATRVKIKGVWEFVDEFGENVEQPLFHSYSTYFGPRGFGREENTDLLTFPADYFKNSASKIELEGFADEPGIWTLRIEGVRPYSSYMDHKGELQHTPIEEEDAILEDIKLDLKYSESDVTAYAPEITGPRYYFEGDPKSIQVEVVRCGEKGISEQPPDVDPEDDIDRVAGDLQPYVNIGTDGEANTEQLIKLVNPTYTYQEELCTISGEIGFEWEDGGAAEGVSFNVRHTPPEGLGQALVLKTGKEGNAPLLVNAREEGTHTFTLSELNYDGSADLIDPVQSLTQAIEVPPCNSGPQVVEERVETRLLDDETGEYALTVHWRLEQDGKPYTNPAYGVGILADTPAGVMALGVAGPDAQGNVDAVYVLYRDTYDTFNVYLEYNEKINNFLQQFPVKGSEIEVVVP